MQIFEVIRWGNGSDDLYTGGPNGPDTCFLVRASSIEQAAELVDRQLAAMPSELVDPWAGAIYQIGTDSSASSDAIILRGPYIQHAFRHGWRHWYRQEPLGSWVESNET